MRGNFTIKTTVNMSFTILAMYNSFKSEFCYEENTVFLIKGKHPNHPGSFVKI